MTTIVSAPSGRRGRPSASQVAQLRQHVIDVAWPLFVKHGFDGVTMNEIAAAGRFSNRTIYSRFRNKEALFIAAVEHRLDAVTSLMALPNAAMPFEAWLRHVTERMLRLIASDELKIVERELVFDSRFAEMPGIVARVYSRALATLEQAIAEQVSGSAIIIASQGLALRCWFDMLVGHVRLRHRVGLNRFDIDIYLDEWLDILVEMSLRLLLWRKN